jgi:hypothetical protein
LVCQALQDLAANGRDGDAGVDFHLDFFADATPPTDPIANSPSHAPGAWSNDPSLQLAWSRADGDFGLAGYSVDFNHAVLSHPDTTVDVPQGSDPHSAAVPLIESDQGCYFHLSTCDLAGLCTSTVHLGPFQIDLTPPTPATAVVSPSHDATAGNPDAIVQLAWTSADDVLSGLAGYALAFDGSSVWACDQQVDLCALAVSAASPPLAQGTWYAHLCAVDAARNWSGVATGGPFLIGEGTASGVSATKAVLSWVGLLCLAALLAGLGFAVLRHGS